MEALLFLILVVLFVRWLVIRGRIRRLSRRLDELSTEVRDLRAEVSALRGAAPAVAASQAPAPVPTEAAAPVPSVAAAPVPDTPAFSFCQWCGRRLIGAEVCHCRALEAAPTLEPAPLTEPGALVEPGPWTEPAPPFVEPEPVVAGPTFSERMRARLGNEEWEALVGGSLLNKLGALLLVIGIALMLGWSFTQTGPAGRAGIGLFVSLTMLIGGFVVERRERYRMFARGLLGGGWAALYFTVYAIHAVEAARIIESPVIGAILLLAVATGMVAHSLRYGSQALTGLAYFAAFAALAITPLTTLTVIALLPLAVSLLYIAQQFGWTGMALFGLVATWGTLLSRGDSGAPAWQAQLIFSLYWLLFEGFDLIRASQRTRYSKRESLILPLNAIVFAGLSYAKWRSVAPEHLWAVSAGVATAFFASAITRAFIRPPASFDEGEGTLARMRSGGYEGPVTIAVMLSVLAVLLRLPGAWATLGLLVEAELLLIAGLVFAERYPRRLAAALFGVEWLKILTFDAGSPAQTTIAGLTIRAWTPVALMSSAVLYVNRYLLRPAQGYAWAASAGLALVIGVEAHERFVGLAWFVLACALFTIGWVRRLGDLRLQAYCAGALGLLGSTYHQANVASGAAAAEPYPWVPLALCAALAYGGVWAALQSTGDRVSEREGNWLRRVASWGVSFLLVLLTVRVVPERYLGLGWMVLALGLLELGLRGIPPEFRVQSYAVAGLGAVTVTFANLLSIRNVGPAEPRMIVLEAAIVAYVFAARVYRAGLSRAIMNASAGMGALFACVGLWAVLPPVAAGPAWAALGLVLVEMAKALGLKGIERQGHTVSAAAFTRLFFANFANTGSTGLVSHRILTVVPVAGAFGYLWSKLQGARTGRVYLHAATVLIFVLLRFELGRMLTVTGWSALALIVLLLGLRRDNADLRFQGYLIAAAAFIRSIATNFYSPDSAAGASGRIAIGAFVILCLYAAQMAIPLPPVRTGIERYARTYFSLLASALTSILLFREVSGSVLTVAWGLQSIVLLAAGFPLRDRALRLSGLFLFLVCIFKLFLYDLRNLETGYRIASFIVLGLMLLSVSWIYTRFRDRIQRFL